MYSFWVGLDKLCHHHLRIMLQYGDTALTLPLPTWVINTIVDEKIFTYLTLLPKCGNPQFGTVLTGPFECERLLIAQPIDFPLNYFKVKEYSISQHSHSHSLFNRNMGGSIERQEEDGNLLTAVFDHQFIIINPP